LKEVVRNVSKKGILFCDTFENVNINGDLEVAGTVRILGFDTFMDIIQGGGEAMDTEMVTVIH
jgi:hypothetical protein